MGVPCISFTSFYRQTSPFILLNPFVFLLTLLSLLYAILKIAFCFLPPPVVQVVRSSSSLYFLVLVVGLPYFRVVAFVLWDTLFGLLFVLFETISLFLF